MDTVTPSTHQLNPNQPLPDSPPTPNTAEAKKPSAAASLLRTLHLRVLGKTAQLAADAAKTRIFVPITALGWLSCAAVNRLFKTASWITGTAKDGEQGYALSKQVQELTSDLIDASQAVRDSRQSHINTINAAAQAIPVVSNVVAVASAIAAKEAEAERAVTWWAKRYTKCAFDFLRYSSPYILQGLHYVSSQVEAVTSSLQTRLYTCMSNPDSVSEHLQDVADKAEAIRYKALQVDTEGHYTKAPHNIKLVPALRQEIDEPEVHIIDTQKIYNEIGPHVVSKGSLYSCFSAIGNAGSSAIDTLASASRSVFESIGASNLASWLASGLNKSAFGLEVLMILPYGKQATASFLEQAGVPVYQVEKTFAKIPEVITKHAVAAEGVVLEAVRWADSKIEQVDNASKAASLQNQLAALTEKTHSSIEALAEAVVEDCVDKGVKYICQTEVYQILKSKENIIAYANKLGLSPDSQEFLLAIQEMATTSNILEAMQEVKEVAKETAAHQASGWSSWFEESLKSISETRIGMGLQHLGKAISPSVQYVASTITTGANDIKDHSIHGVKKLLGHHQALPPKVKEQMDKWREAAIELAATRAQSDSANLSQAALLEIGGLWGSLLNQASSNDAFSTFLRDTYIKRVQPTLQRALNALDTAHNVNAASYNFLSAQMDANLQTELQMQQFLSEKAKIARQIMQDESQGSLTQSVAGAASWGFPILSWLFLSSQSLTVLPFIMQRIVPHVLRSTAETLQNSSKPFWFYLADNTKEVLNKGAVQLKSSSESIGSWLQKTFNAQIFAATGQYYIDPLRLENFKKLSLEEQEHLFTTTGAKAKMPNAPYDVLVQETLKSIDNSALPEASPPPLTLKAYFQLPTEQQEDILFAVAHSSAYKHFLDDNPERAVKKINSLPKSKQSISCSSVKHYNKMTISDKEQARLCIAKNVSYFTDFSNQSLQERMHWNDQMTWNHPIGWEFSEYSALEHTTNHRLRNMLQLYSQLAPQERSIMTPSKLKAMSNEQIEHLIQIIDTYHPELADKFKERFGLNIYKIFTSSHPLEKEKLFVSLASLYNMLPPGQKAKLLELTNDEFAAMPEYTKRELTLFLMHTAQMPEDGDVVTTFNSLSRIKQAEFRESKELADVQKEAITISIEKELSDVSLKLKALQRRITRLTDSHYIALKEQVEQTKRLLDTAHKDKAATSAMLKSLIEAKASNQALEKAQSSLQTSESALQAIEQQLELDTKKLDASSVKLSHLHELEHQYIQKLTSLNTLLGTTMDVAEAIEESPKLTSAIHSTLNNTLNEVGKNMLESLWAVLKEKTAGKEHVRALAFSREFLDEAIKLRKKHLAAVYARISQLKSELEVLKKQKAYDTMAEKRLQLRAHTNFTLKLNLALLAKFEELRQTFETQITQGITLAAPAA